MEFLTISASDVTREPWANGLGWTRELARAGGADWTWRLSLAESSVQARFSNFRGVERLLFLVRGRSLRLVFDDGEDVTVVEPGDCIRFSGDRSVVGTPDGPCTEQLNLMWQPHRVLADWRVLDSPRVTSGSVTPGATRIWHVVSGLLHIAELRMGPETTVIAHESVPTDYEVAAVSGKAIEITLTNPPESAKVARAASRRSKGFPPSGNLCQHTSTPSRQ